jgi:hypothetical protein
VLRDNELHEFKDPHVLIAWIRARISPPPHQMTRLAPGRSMVGDHRPRHARPAREPVESVSFDFPEGRWRRFFGAVRRVLAGEREMAW